MESNIVTYRKIGDKDVYIVANHHEVIIPWSEYSIACDNPPVVLTLDHHIDTRSAFYRYSKNQCKEDWKKVRKQLLLEADIYDKGSVLSSLGKLQNYEHIDFAIETGMISEAIVFSMINAGICKDYSNSDIYYIDPDCLSTCDKTSHDNEECLITMYNHVIESEELRYKLGKANRFIPGFFSFNTINKKYILDIDLDCFHTKKSIEPDDIEMFNYLVRNAEIITIATEADYIEMEKKDDDIYMEYLLDRLLVHIENALL